MPQKNPYTPRELRSLADEAVVGSFDGWGDPRAVLPGDAPDALRWAAKEIEKLRSKVSWMFVMGRRKAAGGQGAAPTP